MGGGAVRNLEEAFVPERPLDPELSARVGKALEHMDRIDPDFKARRDDERFQQQVKRWTSTSKEVETYLRAMGNLMHASHQLSLDIGSEGGGQAIKPFIEDLGQRFPRLFYKLEGAEIAAVSDGKELGRTKLEGINFDFVEKTVVIWVLRSVQGLVGTQPVST